MRDYIMHQLLNAPVACSYASMRITGHLMGIAAMQVQ